MRKLSNHQFKKPIGCILNFFSLLGFYYYYHLYKQLPTTPSPYVPDAPVHPSVTGKPSNLLLGESDMSPDKKETYFLLNITRISSA